MIVHIIEAVYHFLWGDLVTLHLSGTSIGIPLLVLLLIPTGIYFTFHTNFVSVRLFPDMVRSLTEKKGNGNSLSPLQTLFVSTATRVGMGNLVGVVAAVSAGGAGAVFWMWLSRRSGLLYPLLCRKSPWKETEPLCDCSFLRLIRTLMLVRHQPGDQQLRCLCL